MKGYRTTRGSERITRAADLPARVRCRTVPLFLLTFALAACSDVHRSETNRPSSPSPAGISSSYDVVKISAPEIKIADNGSADATVLLSVSPGYHINSNPATFPYLIPTELQIGREEGGIRAGKPVYPTSQKKKFRFSAEPLAVYEGEVQIKLPLRAGTNITRPGWLPISVTVQACDNEKCYPPAILNTMIRWT